MDFRMSKLEEWLDKSAWWCDACGAVSTDGPLLACSGCHLRVYCNHACQKAAWKEHKVLCKAYSSLDKFRFTQSLQECAKALRDAGLAADLSAFLCSYINRIQSSATGCCRVVGRCENLASIVDELSTSGSCGSVFGTVLYNSREIVTAALTIAAAKGFLELNVTLMVLKRVFALFDSGEAELAEPHECRALLEQLTSAPQLRSVLSGR
jgi:hypothetical protein